MLTYGIPAQRRIDDRRVARRVSESESNLVHMRLLCRSVNRGNSGDDEREVSRRHSSESKAGG